MQQLKQFQDPHMRMFCKYNIGQIAHLLRASSQYLQN